MLTFGLTASLWGYRDPQWRLETSPLLSVELWHQALAAAGFVDVEVSGVRVPRT